MFGIKIIKESEWANLQEEMTRYQRTLEDIGWINLSIDQDINEIIPIGIEKAIKRSRLYYYNNPLAAQWVNLVTAFSFGEGVSIPSVDDDEIQEAINDFWNDLDNRKTLTSFWAQQALSNKLQYEGNLFFVLFDDEKGNVKVRILNAVEVKDIIMDEEDRNRPMFYKVMLAEKKYNFSNDSFSTVRRKVLYYPDIDNFVPDQFGVPDSKLVRDAKVFHAKINCDVNDKFGVPVLYRGVDWMKAHKDMAGDLATLIKALSEFAWKKKVKGGAAKVNAIKAAMATKTDLSNIRNTVGKYQIENEGIDLQSIDIKTGGVKVGTEGLKSMQLMISAASGIFYHYFGDPSTGNLATAKSMELPMVKMFTAYQTIWSGIYMSLITYSLNKKVEVGLIKGESEFDNKTRREIVKLNSDVTIDVDFPPLLESDLKELAESLEVAKRAKLIGTELAAQLFLLGANVNNVKEEIEKMLDEMEKEKQENPQPPAPPDPNNPQPEPNPEPVKETIDTPNNRIATRLAKKSNYTLQRLNGYRKALAGHYRAFHKDIQKSIQASGVQGHVVGNVNNLQKHTRKLAENMMAAARAYFPVAVDIGQKFMQSSLKDMGISFREDNGRASGILNERLQWNDQFVNDSLRKDVEAGIAAVMRQAYDSEDEFREAVNKKVISFEPRLEHYVGAFWTVEEHAVKEAGRGTGVMVNFAGADDGGTCQGCADALAGNPWPIDEAPIPGEQDCLGRCRHALQVIVPEEE